jgi:hypothetical protein
VKANPLKGCTGTAKWEGRIYWMSKIEQELERLDIGYIWQERRNTIMIIKF